MDARARWFHRLTTALYTVMYVAFAGIGWFQLVAPSAAVRAEAGVLVYVWAVMLLAGGILATVGLLGSWWLPELAGQPLLAFPFVLWGFAVGVGEAPSRWAFVCLCLVITARAAARSVELWRGVQPKRGGL